MYVSRQMVVAFLDKLREELEHFLSLNSSPSTVPKVICEAFSSVIHLSQGSIKEHGEDPQGFILILFVCLF